MAPRLENDAEFPFYIDELSYIEEIELSAMIHFCSLLKLFYIKPALIYLSESRGNYIQDLRSVYVSKYKVYSTVATKIRTAPRTAGFHSAVNPGLGLVSEWKFGTIPLCVGIQYRIFYFISTHGHLLDLDLISNLKISENGILFLGPNTGYQAVRVLTASFSIGLIRQDSYEAL